MLLKECNNGKTLQSQRNDALHLTNRIIIVIVIIVNLLAPEKLCSKMRMNTKVILKRINNALNCLVVYNCPKYTKKKELHTCATSVQA